MGNCILKHCFASWQSKIHYSTRSDEKCCFPSWESNENLALQVGKARFLVYICSYFCLFERRSNAMFIAFIIKKRVYLLL